MTSAKGALMKQVCSCCLGLSLILAHHLPFHSHFELDMGARAYQNVLNGLTATCVVHHDGIHLQAYKADLAMFIMCSMLHFHIPVYHLVHLVSMPIMSSSQEWHDMSSDAATKVV